MQLDSHQQRSKLERQLAALQQRVDHQPKRAKNALELPVHRTNGDQDSHGWRSAVDRNVPSLLKYMDAMGHALYLDTMQRATKHREGLRELAEQVRQRMLLLCQSGNVVKETW